MARNLDRPNVILIVLDTARADAFEPYGAPAGRSPAAAQIASRGAAFGRAIAPCNWTMPSHASMLTGLLPRTAGLSSLPGGAQENCRPVLEGHGERLLPEFLRRAGYRTRGASTNLWVSTRLGFATGFDEFQDLVGKRVARMHRKDLRSRLAFYAHAYLAELDDGLTTVEEVCRRWMDDPGRPFFWFMNLIECHSPYLPPKPYNDFGAYRRLRAALDARRYQTLEGVWRACATGQPPPERALARMRHLYARSVRLMDDWLGRLLEDLDSRGLLDETLVIVTSDHGENFGEGGMFGHAVSLDDRLLRVPFILAGPGTPPTPPEAWTLARLPHLVAEAAGFSDHPWGSSDLPEHIAVAQYDTGLDPADERMKLFHDWGATEDGLLRFTAPGTCATDGRYKVVRHGTVERCYDVVTDPAESDPLDPSAQAGVPQLDELRRAIDTANASEWIPDIDELAAAERPDADEVASIEERMRLLGYL